MYTEDYNTVKRYISSIDNINQQEVCYNLIEEIEKKWLTQDLQKKGNILFITGYLRKLLNQKIIKLK